MNKGLMGLLVVLTVAFSVPAELHAEGTVWEKAQSDRYSEKAVGMFGRGLLNVATSPIDLVVQTVEGTQEGPPLIGTLGGLGGGLGCTAIRVSSGIIDVLTFWVPDFNGFSVNQSYSNCLESSQSSQDYSGMQQNYAAPQSQSLQGTTVVGQPAAASSNDAMKYVKKGTYDQSNPMQYIKKGTSSTPQNRSAYIK